MINIIQEPESFAYSRNIIQYILQETDGIKSPAKATLFFENFSVSDEFTIKLKSGQDIIAEETFTFVNASSSNNEITIEAANLIGDFLNKNILTAPYFDIVGINSIGNQKIQFYAKEYDETQTIEIETTTGTTESTAPNGGSLDNYSIEVDILFERTINAGDWEVIATLSDTPDHLGKVTYQIQKIIDQAIRETKTVPKNYWDSNNIEKDEFNDYRFSIRYKIYSGTPPVLLSKFVFAPKTAIAGGIAQNLWSQYGFEINEENTLLSYHPTGKQIAPNQKELLSYISFGEEKPKLKVITYDRDNNANTLYTGVPGAATNRAKKTWTFQIGPEDIGAGDDILYYDVGVFIDIGGAEVSASPTKRYYIDRNYYGDDTRQIMYYNALACPETFSATGNLSKNLKISRQTVERILPADYSSLFEQTYQEGAEWHNYFTYRTGFISAAEADALQEALISDYVFEIFDEGYIPIRITTNSFKVSESRKGLHSYTFLAQPTLSQKNYTNLNRIFTSTTEVQGWNIAAADYWRTVFGLKWQIA